MNDNVKQLSSKEKLDLVDTWINLQGCDTDTSQSTRDAAVASGGHRQLASQVPHGSQLTANVEHSSVTSMDTSCETTPEDNHPMQVQDGQSLPWPRESDSEGAAADAQNEFKDMANAVGTQSYVDSAGGTTKRNMVLVSLALMSLMTEVRISCCRMVLACSALIRAIAQYFITTCTGCPSQDGTA